MLFRPRCELMNCKNGLIKAGDPITSGFTFKSDTNFSRFTSSPPLYVVIVFYTNPLLTN